MIPFLLIPGLNCTARVYQSAAEALWPYGPVSIANHLEGDGIARIAARILANAPPHFALAGFSMGGYLAFEILRRAPERVTRLALLDTTARPDSADSTANRRRRMSLAEAGKFEVVIRESFPNSVQSEHLNDATLLGIHSTMARSNGPEVYVRHQKAIISRPDSRPDLGAVAVPTLVVVGEADAITPPEAAREMHEAIRGSRLVVVPKAGHLALLEQPEIVNVALRDWAAG